MTRLLSKNKSEILKNKKKATKDNVALLMQYTPHQAEYKERRILAHIFLYSSILSTFCGLRLFNDESSNLEHTVEQILMYPAIETCMISVFAIALHKFNSR
jgi:hypothetical protein